MFAVKDGEALEVTRYHTPQEGRPGVLWCPHCDFSSMEDRTTCGGCGAEFVEEPPNPKREVPEYEVDTLGVMEFIADGDVNAPLLGTVESETWVDMEPLSELSPGVSVSDGQGNDLHVCVDCSRNFDTAEALDTHVGEEHPTTASTAASCLCGHLQAHHPQENQCVYRRYCGCQAFSAAEAHP